MLWFLTQGRRLNLVYLAFMAVAFMVGVAGALQAPTLSLFLTREVKVSPFWVGLFYTVNATAGIVISLLLAKRSDKRGDRRKLIILCCAMAVANSLVFAFNRHYITLVTLGGFSGGAGQHNHAATFCPGARICGQLGPGSGDVQFSDAGAAITCLGHRATAVVYAGVTVWVYHDVSLRSRDLSAWIAVGDSCAAFRTTSRVA